VRRAAAFVGDVGEEKGRVLLGPVSPPKRFTRNHGKRIGELSAQLE
jgi:hypothetical protein